MRKILIFLLSSLFIILSAKTIISQEKTYLVTRVIDGDTIQLKNGETVRYIGINTPETKHPTKGVEFYGKEAFEANRKLVENKRVKLELDVQPRDKYGRLLAYVWVGEIFVNAWLVENGYAEVMTIPPNVKYQDLFLKLQKQAREKNIGLWAIPSSTTNQTINTNRQTNTSDIETIVYITKTGEKYHRAGCRYLSKSMISISIKDAKARGYTPCSVCQPPE